MAVPVPGALWKCSTHGPPLNMLYGNRCLPMMTFYLFSLGPRIVRNTHFLYIKVPSMKKSSLLGWKATELRQKEKTQNEANRLEVNTLRPERVHMPPMQEENDLPSNL